MSKAAMAPRLREVLAWWIICLVWFFFGAFASEALRELLEGASISAFAFLLARFSVYGAVGYVGAQLIQWRGIRAVGPSLVVGLLMAAERLTYHYEIYRFSMLSVLNLSIDFLGFAGGVFLSWQACRSGTRRLERNAPAP